MATWSRMNLLRPLLILAAAFLAVFLETAWSGPARWLGAQIDLLPGLMVYASLTAGWPTIVLLGTVGGLWFDSLSANPLGASVLPLLGCGAVIFQFRHLILREQPYAQWVLGLGASAAAPVLTVLLLTSMGFKPILGSGSLWQWLVMSLGGSALTPVYFRLFDRLDRALSYRPAWPSAFRPDREIERGRF